MKHITMLFGYLSTATVITGVLGLTYLWGSNRLDDEKVFRMVALLHDVDIGKIANETGEAAGEMPDEEPSPEDVEWRRQVLARNHELKLEALKRGKLNFDASWNTLVTDMDRFHDIAAKLEQSLQEQGKLSSKRSLQQVVSYLEQMRPAKAKDELLNIFEEENGTQNVIKIIGSMNTSKLKKIVQQFQTEPEQEKLHLIFQELLNGGAQRAVFQNALEELHRLKSNQ